DRLAILLVALLAGGEVRAPLRAPVEHAAAREEAARQLARLLAIQTAVPSQRHPGGWIGRSAARLEAGQESLSRASSRRRRLRSGPSQTSTSKVSGPP